MEDDAWAIVVSAISAAALIVFDMPVNFSHANIPEPSCARPVGCLAWHGGERNVINEIKRSM